MYEVNAPVAHRLDRARRADRLAAIAPAASSALETETFATTTAYDALNRPTSITTPDASEIRPGYNEAGLLEKVDLRVRYAASWTAFVADIDDDAKGQREQIVYGAGATTTEYSYDPLTFRMTQIKTTRASDDAVLQNLQYTYDPVGNITEIKDSAQQTVFFDDDVVLPVMAYTYDALYRLTQATGRELTAIAAFAPDLDDVPVSLPHANNMNAVRNYTQEYVYDAVGNILQMVHKIGATPEWTRHYKYETDAGSNPISNRLLATSAFADEGDFSATYAYDEHGNMVSMPHLSTVVWNHRDEMASADLGGGGVVYFTYDSAGQRVRKVYEHSGLVEERIYLGGFEVYRKRVASTGVVTVERETLHVMDGVQRVALVETKTVDTAAGGSFTPETVTRLQLGNHLGSAALEVDLAGAVISYEEYHPYGTTAYEAASGAVEVSRKRYRYTGKERDEETGLYYHGARYYAPWLGRWTAADPAGLVDGPNSYEYVRAHPVRLRDPDGRESSETVRQMNARLVQTINEELKLPDQAAQVQASDRETNAIAKSTNRRVVQVIDLVLTPSLTQRARPPAKPKDAAVPKGPERKSVVDLKVSDDLVQFMSAAPTTAGEGWENFEPQTKDDVTGNPTIGFGKFLKTKDQIAYFAGRTITREEGRRLLGDDFKARENYVRNKITAKLSQNEFDALVSLTFNGALKKGLIEAINKGGDTKAAFDRVIGDVKSNGQALPGLPARHVAEAKMFFQGKYELRKQSNVELGKQILQDVARGVRSGFVERALQ